MTTTAPTKSIAQMQQDLLKYRASKLGTPDPTAAPAAPATTTPDQGADASTNEAIGASLASYRQDRSDGKTTAIPKDDPSKLAQFAKGLFGSTATLAARPFQAVAELAGASEDSVDAFSNKYSGGLVAPVPRKYSDVLKDVGRGAQTIALGLDAPIAAGALFGGGTSLEQGNDLLSTQTAFDTVLGAGGGKLLDLVGKPLLNAAGKVVGKITPTILKDVAAGGAKAIADFAARHDIPVVGAVTKPVSEGLTKGARAVDATINKGFKAGGAALKETAAKQFPGLNPVDHYINAAERDLVKPTTLNDSKYAKATSIYKDAQNRGIDLPKVATANRVFHDDNVGAGKFNTSETEQTLRNQVYGEGADVIRPAIAAQELGVQRVPISEVRDTAIRNVDAIPATKANAEQKAAMKETINKRYSDGSERDAAIARINADTSISSQVKAQQIRLAKQQFPEASAEAKAHPNGYSLTDLHNGRIERGANGKYVPGISDPPTVAAARLARQEERAFRDLFDKNLPKKISVEGKMVDNPLIAIRRKHEETLLLADYLKALNGKKVPEGVTKKAVRLFGRAAAATVGGKIGGFPGAILGSQYGDILFASFSELPNPLKKVVLNSLEKQKSPLFDVLNKFMKSTKAEQEAILKLPAAGGSSFKATKPTLFTTPGGVSTPDKGAAIDLTAVEKGAAKVPKDGRTPAARKRLIEYVQENGQGPYVPASSLPEIKTGRIPKKPGSLKDIKF